MLPVLLGGVGQVRGHVILSYKIVLVFSICNRYCLGALVRYEAMIVILSYKIVLVFSMCYRYCLRVLVRYEAM